MMKKILFVCFWVFISVIAQAQSKSSSKSKSKSGSATKPETEAEPFPLDSLELMLRSGINALHVHAGFDSLEGNTILQSASEEQALYMAESGKAELTGENKEMKDTESRLRAFGGSKNGEEIVYCISVAKGKANIFAKEAALSVLKKWKDSKKEKPILTNGNYVFLGLSAKAEESGKKVYVSAVLAGYNLINNGAREKSQLKVPFSKKSKKIRPPNLQECKNCDKFKDYDSLRSGLYVNDKGEVCIRYYDLKPLRKLFKQPKDGIAVDIVQRAQYENPGYNIYDNNLLTKGILIKPISGDKLFRNNKAKFQEKSKGKKEKKEESLDSKIGRFPKGLKGDYEMNLLILQDGHVCKVVRRAYVETGLQKSSSCDLLLMPDSEAYLNPVYEPKSESGLLSFKIPFEKNKSDYREEDIRPFLDAMQEPDYTIEGIYVTAYSSIEGDSASNTQLQKGRAKSIIDAIKKQQHGSGIQTSIKTRDSWILFTMEMDDGNFAYLCKMSKKNAIHTINTKPGLADSLEPFLAKERFAQLVLDVTYDITGPKEERFCVLKFNSAVRKRNIKQAEKIQYYIERNVSNKKFAPEAISQMEIPREPAFSGLLMNKVMYAYFRNNHHLTEEMKNELRGLSSLDPANTCLKYNVLFCRMQEEPVYIPSRAALIQSQIDSIYKAPDFPKHYINALNTEFQFKQMDALDTIAGSEVSIQNCVNRIKTFYTIKDATWQNSLKLAYVFIKHKECGYAASLLAPFINGPKVNEEILFAYISACSNVPEKLSSHGFAFALQRAFELYPDRYCKLFGEPNLSFQALDIPKVKEDYLRNKTQCQ
jgi:hypothetical protein